MPNKRTLFSIVIPVYNVEEYLERCLTSIISQTFTNWEMIVINDCSPDDSQDIIDDFAGRDPRIKSVINNKNRGLGGARNVGIKHCIGEFILFIDSDDFISSEDVLDKLYDQVSTKNLDVLDTRYRVLEEGKPDSILPKKFKAINERVYTGKRYLDTVDILPVVAWNKVYRRSFLEKRGILFKERKYEDICFTLEALYKAKRVQNSNLVFYNYIVRAGSIMTSRPNASSINDAWGLCKDLEAMYERFGKEGQIEKSFFYSFVSLTKLLQVYGDVEHKTKVKKHLGALHGKYRMQILRAKKMGLVQRLSLFIHPRLTLFLMDVKKINNRIQWSLTNDRVC